MKAYTILCGDSLHLLKGMSDNSFGVCCFSPPYGVGSYFDICKDFSTCESKFLHYLKEITRVSDITAINFTQLFERDKRNSLFIEKMIISAETLGIRLYDRWVIEKPSVKPRRGERALSGWEYVLLFLSPSVSEFNVIPRNNAYEYRTLLKCKGHSNYSKKDASFRYVGTTPYFPEIPRQVIEMYGRKKTLDPFCGTGTTLMESLKLGIPCVGIDIVPDIVKCAKRNCEKTVKNGRKVNITSLM